MVDSVKTVYCAQSSRLCGKQDSRQQAGADDIEAFVSRWDAERITPDIEKIKNKREPHLFHRNRWGSSL